MTTGLADSAQQASSGSRRRISGWSVPFREVGPAAVPFGNAGIARGMNFVTDTTVSINGGQQMYWPA
jgi:hypothetical protein